MISTVHTPLPIFAETVPKIWPHFWAPSPESETISMVCSATSTKGGASRAVIDSADDCDVVVVIPAVHGQR